MRDAKRRAGACAFKRHLELLDLQSSPGTSSDDVEFLKRFIDWPEQGHRPLKAVFFVRDFTGNPAHIEQKAFDKLRHGRRIEVTFIDGEVIVGSTLNYQPDGDGFFVLPADARSNNMRIFAVSGSVRHVRFP